MLPRRLLQAGVVVLLLGAHALGSAPRASAASAEEIERKLQALQDQVNALRRQLDEAKAASPPPPAAPISEAVSAPPAPSRPIWLSDFKLGGYGSTRFEASDLKDFNNTFTFRRFVLSGDATIGERLRGLVEIELERFTELEVERRTLAEGGLRGFSQSIEGSDQSEIHLEQAWVQFALADWARFRAGAILVPVGRFNINHDDNRWDLPRRSLVDRGCPSSRPQRRGPKSAWASRGTSRPTGGGSSPMSCM